MRTDRIERTNGIRMMNLDEHQESRIHPSIIVDRHSPPRVILSLPLLLMRISPVMLDDNVSDVDASVWIK